MSDTVNQSALPAFVRGMRTLLAVQLTVALIAVAATVWALRTLPGLRAEHVRLSTAVTELTARSDATSAVLQATSDAFPFVSQGIDAGAKGDWQAAAQWLGRANGVAENNPSILRALAWAEYMSQSYEAALEHIALARDFSGNDLVLQDFIRQATFECAAGKPDAALSTLRSEGFLPAARANASLILTDDALLQACGVIRSEVVALTGTFAGAPAPDVAAFKVRTVFLHIARAEDREAARGIRESLRAEGYSVPPIEHVPQSDNPSVRYYYRAQKEEADRIAQIVKDSATELRIDAWDDAPFPALSLEGRYKDLPTNVVEVWLPAGT